MNQLNALISAGPTKDTPHAEAITAAMACLDRFTAAFNACDLAAMDAELHFPHSMLSGSEQHVWSGPGQHPPNLFATLRELGWAFTQYESREPILAGNDKVHFAVAYTRRRSDGSVLSEHHNLWIATQVHGKWGIVWRSY